MSVKLNEFAEPLIKFWSELEDTIHPRDRIALRENQNTLNTRYPPPAFIGDLRHASIIVLMANGGYHEDRTRAEFNDARSAELYRERLRNPGACDETNTAAYYLIGDLGKWLGDGRAAVVNALAYRSPNISKEPENRRVAELLPSVQFHRQWLRSHLIPASRLKKVLVIAKRPRLWRLSESENVSECFLFPKNYVSQHLPGCLVEQAERFLSAISR